MKKDIISKDNKISDIVERSSKVVEILYDYGLACATCFLGQFETLEQGAKLHGMTDKEINKLVEEINKVLKK